MKRIFAFCFFIGISLQLAYAQASLYPNFVYEPKPAYFNGASNCGIARPTLNLNSCIAPTFFDWDRDGLIDLFFGRSNGRITYFHNVGSTTNPCFEWVTDQFGGLVVSAGNAAPFFVDLNADGTPDCVIGNGQSASVGGTLSFFKGVGSINAPQFVMEEDTMAGYDLSDASVPFLTDIDDDGDFDLFTGEGYGRSSFIENTGDIYHPKWGPIITLSHDLGWRSAPQIVNIRGSEKKEWVSFESYGIMHIANDTCPTQDTAKWEMPFSNFTELDFCLETGGCWVRGAFADVNGDNLLDILVSSGGIHRFYFNTGTTQSPAFDIMHSQLLPIFSEEFAAAFADLDHDDQIEMYLPRNDGKIRVYENTGADSLVSWDLINEDFLELNTSYTKAITFGDVNNDGLTDAVVGFIYAPSGRKMEIYINQGQMNAPILVYTPSPALENYPFLQTAIPLLTDYESDGEMDLIITYSSVLRFRNLNNSGVDWSPTSLTGFPSNISATKLSFGDLDGDGDQDAVRSGYGTIGYFENKGSNSQPSYEIQPYAFRNDMAGVYATIVDLGAGCGKEIWLDHQFWEFKGIKPAIKNPNSSTFCSNNPPKQIDALPKGGWWQGASSTGSFDPGQGEGAYLVIYHYTDLYGCHDHSDSVWLYVIDAPNADIVSLNGATIQNDTIDVCKSLPAQTLTTAEACGYFSGSITSSGVFYPQNWPLGLYTATHYCYSSGCIDYDTLYIQITAPPAAQINQWNSEPINSSVVTVCQNSGPQYLGGFPVGGVFSGISAPDGIIYPNTLAPGIYSVFYQVEIGGCSSNAQIAVRVLDCTTDVSDLENPDIKPLFRISPNPASTMVAYDVELFEPTLLRLERYDLDGRLQVLIQPEIMLQPGIYRWEEIAPLSGTQWIRLAANDLSIGRLLFCTRSR